MIIEANDAIPLITAGNARAIDATYVLPNSDRDAYSEYLVGHIPGAVYFDIDIIADTTAPLPHTMPSADTFTAMVQNLGIKQGEMLICYDQSGFLSASRVWWMFRFFGHENVQILNGGLNAWKAAGGALESGASKLEKGDFISQAPPQDKHDGYRLVDFDGMVELVATPPDARPMQIVDARPQVRFSGQMPEPRPGMASGHMPGAINCPITSLMEQGTGKIKPPETLKTIFAEANIAMDKPVVTTCGSGVTACGLAFAMALLGKFDVALYDGSWSEWGGADTDREKCPVAKA